VCPRLFEGTGPRPTRDGGEGGGERLIYYLDVVCKVAKERRLELELETSVWVYGPGMYCVWSAHILTRIFMRILRAFYAYPKVRVSSEFGLAHCHGLHEEN
jgi:hypothetical protein